MTPRKLGWAAVYVSIGIVVLLSLFVINKNADTTQAIREAQQNNHDLLASINHVAHEIDDCTRPAGDCFRRGQKRTAGAVALIGQRQIVTAACQVVLARQSPNATVEHLSKQIGACVSGTIAQLNRR